MTNRDAYIFGWVFGRTKAEIEKAGGHVNDDLGICASNPNRASGKILHRASNMRLLHLGSKFDEDIGKALCQLEEIPDPDEGLQPIDVRNSWTLGYYKGIYCEPLPAAEKKPFDIETRRREKKLSQAQLAELVGVTQAQVSRWEKGQAQPGEENRKKLMEVLS